MTQTNELESLKMTNQIQQKVIQQRGDELTKAIILLVKILPIANNRALKTPLEEEIIKEVREFLSDER